MPTLDNGSRRFPEEEQLSVLVTGGAGYIGSHAVKELLRRNLKTIVLDDLSQGHRQAVKGSALVVERLQNEKALVRLIERFNITDVIHFAASSLVGESMKDPQKYYCNNVCGTLSLLRAMLSRGVKRIIFSSTASVYGEAEETPITEEARSAPTNVYGRSKWMIEEILRDYARAYDIRYVSLRYFNVAGADESGELGEDHSPETHLIPIIMEVLLGRRDHLDLYGTDYPTEDGTCIRDYIHVTDLAVAHILSLQWLESGGLSRVYNLGNGSGFSNRQVIATAERAAGSKIAVREADRRPGDPAVLVASSERIQSELGWRPRCSDLESIITSAWRWHSGHPEGFT
jgi:UDP-glucose 4-epimerase